MKGRNVVILLLVVLIIASCAFVVVHGFTYGEKGEYTFSPIKSIKMGLDLTGGVYIVYEAADPSVEDLDTKLQGAMDIFRTRLDSKGFTEATITKQGTTKIRVEIPINSTSEITDSSEVISFISEAAISKAGRNGDNGRLGNNKSRADDDSGERLRRIAICSIL